MNEKIKELLEGIKLTIGSLEDKNEQGILKDDIVTALQEVHKKIGDIELPVTDASEKVKENEIRSNVVELYKEYLTRFVSASELKEEKEIEEKFIVSEQRKEFNNVVFKVLTEALKEEKIEAKEYDEIMDTFEIKATEEEIKKVIADAVPPMPTDDPGEGNQWVWDANSMKWIKEKKKSTV